MAVKQLGRFTYDDAAGDSTFDGQRIGMAVRVVTMGKPRRVLGYGMETLDGKDLGFRKRLRDALNGLALYEGHGAGITCEEETDAA